MLILKERFFSISVWNTMTCLKPDLFFSTEATGRKCVFFFSFSGAHQLLIIFHHIDLLPLFLPYGLMSDIIRSTASCTERTGLMHYSRHINTCSFIWSFQSSPKKHQGERQPDKDKNGDGKILFDGNGENAPTGAEMKLPQRTQAHGKDKAGASECGLGWGLRVLNP